MKTAARGDAMKPTIALLAAVAFLLLPIRGPAQTSTVPWFSMNSAFGVSSSSTNLVKSAIGDASYGLTQGATRLVELGFVSDTLFRTVATSVAEPDAVPKEYALEQNYPNPFNPNTTIKFELPRASQVSLTVYDILGREVSVLVNDRRDAGVHEVEFDGSNLASGVYFYRMKAGDYVSTKRMLVVR
jgi:hypothetical protein